MFASVSTVPEGITSARVLVANGLLPFALTACRSGEAVHESTLAPSLEEMIAFKACTSPNREKSVVIEMGMQGYADQGCNLQCKHGRQSANGDHTSWI